MLSIYPLISNTHQQLKNNQNINFGYRLPKTPVENIRDIAHLTCACCGGKMFTPETTDKFIKSFSASSARALENSFLSRFKNGWAFKFVKELSKKIKKFNKSNEKFIFLLLFSKKSVIINL